MLRTNSFISLTRLVKFLLIGFILFNILIGCTSVRSTQSSVKNKKVQKLLTQAADALAIGDISSTISLANEALYEGDLSGDADYLLSKCTDDNTQKLTLLNDALGKNPYHTSAGKEKEEIQFIFAEDYINKGKDKKAIRLLTQIIEEYPEIKNNNIQARQIRQQTRYVYAQKRFNNGDFLEAEQYANSILKEKGSLVENDARTLLFNSRIGYARRVSQNIKNFKVAEEYYTKALTIFYAEEVQTERNRLRLNYAHYCMNNRNAKEAKKYLIKIVVEEPLNTRAKNSLSNIYFSEGQVLLQSSSFKSAEKQFTLALAQTPLKKEITNALTNARILYARKQRNKGIYDEALKYYNKLLGDSELSIREEIDDTRCEYADHLRIQKNYTKSLKILREIQDTTKSCYLEIKENISFNQVEDAIKVSDYSKAKRNLEQAIKLFPNSSFISEKRLEIYLALVQQAKRKGDYVKAHEYINSLDINLDTVQYEKADIYYKQAISEIKKKNYNQAFDYFNQVSPYLNSYPEKIRKLKNSRAAVYLMMADERTKQNDYEGGLSLIEQAKAETATNATIIEQIKRRSIQIHFSQTEEAIKKADYNAAHNFLALVAKIDNDINPEIQEKHTNIYWLQVNKVRDKKRKLEHLDSILAIKPSNINAIDLKKEIWYQLTNEAIEKRKFESAIEYLDAITDSGTINYKDSNKKRTHIFLELGKEAVSNLRLEDAIYYYDNARRNNPQLDLQIRFLKSEVYARMFKLDEAVNLLLYCLENNYEEEEVVYRLARYNCVMGKLEDAMEYLYDFQDSYTYHYDTYRKKARTQNEFYNLKHDLRFQMWLYAQRRIQLQVHRVFNIPDTDWDIFLGGYTDPYFKILIGNDEVTCPNSKSTHDVYLSDCLLTTDYTVSTSAIIEVWDDDTGGDELVGRIPLNSLPISLNRRTIKGEQNMNATISVTDFSHGILPSFATPDLSLSYLQVGYEFTSCVVKISLPLPEFMLLVGIETAIKAGLSNDLKRETRQGAVTIAQKYITKEIKSRFKETIIPSTIKVVGYTRCFLNLIDRIEDTRP